LEQSQKTILSIIFVCQIEGKGALEILKKKTMLSENIINSEIDDLIKNQFVNEDRNSLTGKGILTLFIQDIFTH
jgi:glycerol-3-phosphate cytidylyltransferase/FAD synthetase